MNYLIFDMTTRKIERTLSTPGVPSPGSGYDYIRWPVDSSGKLVPLQPGDTVNADKGYVPYTPSLAYRQAAKLAAAQAVFDALIAAGFTYGGVRSQIDSDSQVQLAAMSLMALGSITDPANSPWPAGFYWVAADNSHVSMDAPTTYAFGRAVAGYVSACILRLRAIKNMIATAADQPTLDAIDVTAGYPAPTA
jgi:hypothetical protein